MHRAPGGAAGRAGRARERRGRSRPAPSSRPAARRIAGRQGCAQPAAVAAEPHTRPTPRRVGAGMRPPWSRKRTRAAWPLVSTRRSRRSRAHVTAHKSDSGGGGRRARTSAPVSPSSPIAAAPPAAASAARRERRVSWAPAALSIASNKAQSLGEAGRGSTIPRAAHSAAAPSAARVPPGSTNTRCGRSATASSAAAKSFEMGAPSSTQPRRTASGADRRRVRAAAARPGSDAEPAPVATCARTDASAAAA
eukprot:scaffold472_cov109-Isochrysis_galbana.AAC.13